MLESDLQKLVVDGTITLYELNASKLGAGIYRWHGHTSFEDWEAIESWAGATDISVGSPSDFAGGEDARDNFEVKSDIIWKGQAYSAIPIRTDGLEVRGDGQASMPVLALASDFNGVVGLIRVLCLRYADFVGCTLTVTRTLTKYLDAANFISGNPLAASLGKTHHTQTWYIERKKSENSAFVSFELSNPVDFADAKIPSREITSYCHWCVHGQYRGERCGYIGAAMFTEAGLPTDNPALDKCGGRISDCKIRFGEGNTLRHGGFPSANSRV